MLSSNMAGRTDGVKGCCLGGSVPQHQLDQHQEHGQEQFHWHPYLIKFMFAHFHCLLPIQQSQPKNLGQCQKQEVIPQVTSG